MEGAGEPEQDFVQGRGVASDSRGMYQLYLPSPYRVGGGEWGGCINLEVFVHQ